MQIPDGIDFLEYVEFVGKQESQEIHWAGNWRDELISRAANGQTIIGDRLPWGKTHNTVRLREGELSIWAGINGHKKSMILGQIILWLAKTRRVCIASLEMKPSETLYRMAKQAAGCDPSTKFINEFTDWADDKICVYDQLDTVEEKRIFGFITYAAKELKCAHIVIDSLTKCGLTDGDYAAEKKFVDKLQYLAKNLNVHIHLVSHVAKPSGQGEEYKPNKFSVKGSGAITDLADNVFLCWSNKRRAAAKDKIERGMNVDDDEMMGCDQELIVAKQRHGAWDGVIKLWFHDSSFQCIGEDVNKPMPFDMTGDLLRI